MRCLQCNKEFAAVRVTARYCSVSCKLKYARRTDPAELSVSKPLSVSSLSVSNDTVRVSVSSGIDTLVPGNVCVYRRPDGSRYVLQGDDKIDLPARPYVSVLDRQYAVIKDGLTLEQAGLKPMRSM